jgi:hypothetical protein
MSPTVLAEAQPRAGARTRDRPVAYLLLLGLLLRLALAWAPFSYLAERGPLIDDAFYSLSTARNLASGHGLSADGLHETSGFQPLFTLALVPIFRLFPEDRILPVHLTLTLLAICGAGTGWFLFRIARRIASRPAALFSLFLWSVSPYFLSHGQNGLETGVYGLLFAAALDGYLGGLEKRRSPLAVGVLLGLCVLARVDGLILVAVIALDLAWSAAREEKLSGIVALVLPVVLIAGPYFLFLFMRFGSFLPESGAATRLLSLCFGSKFVERGFPTVYFDPSAPPLSYYAGSLREAILVLSSEPLLFPFSLPLSWAGALRLSQGETTILAFFATCLMALNLAAMRLGREPSARLRDFGRVSLALITLWIPAYAFGAQGQWWFPRYFFPLFLLMTIASGPVLDSLEERLSWIRPRSPAFWWAGAAILHLVAFAAQVPSRFLISQRNLNVSSFLSMARVLDRNLPTEARAGAFQSGTLSYFASRPIVNLDGVVNAGASRALREKRMLDYVREQRIAAVIDAPFIIEALLVRRSDEREARSLAQIQRTGQITLVPIPPRGTPSAATGREP